MSERGCRRVPECERRRSSSYVTRLTRRSAAHIELPAGCGVRREAGPQVSDAPELRASMLALAACVESHRELSKRGVAGAPGCLGRHSKTRSRLQRSGGPAHWCPNGTSGCCGVVVLVATGRPAPAQQEPSTRIFRRVKAGRRPGYPRFKGRAALAASSGPRTVTVPAGSPDTGRVYLQGIGQRQSHGAPRGAGTGEDDPGPAARAAAGCSILSVPGSTCRYLRALPATGRQAGIDMRHRQLRDRQRRQALRESAQVGRVAAEQLAAAQQRLTRAKRGSKNRGSVPGGGGRAATARSPASRRDFHHKAARQLVRHLRPPCGGGPGDRQHDSQRAKPVRRSRQSRRVFRANGARPRSRG